ncbi:hypothetical protein JTB14_022715 [Gonioctena quinquepunctata]|nr:hypothetical protein JTB14_022715 [Gonioctena quinquepunctata]
MSFDRSILEPIHKSGWIGILSEWMKHPDVRISIPAARALANLDIDNEHLYSRRLYLLYPMMRTLKDQDVDVVFVHGLLGGVFYTWRQRNKNQSSLGIIGKNAKKESLQSNLDHPDVNGKKTTMQFFKDLKEQIETENLFKDYEFVWDDIPVYTNSKAEGPYTCSAYSYDSKDVEGKYYTYCWPKDWLPEDCQNIRIIGIESMLYYCASIMFVQIIVLVSRTHTQLINHIVYCSSLLTYIMMVVMVIKGDDIITKGKNGSGCAKLG